MVFFLCHLHRGLRIAIPLLAIYSISQICFWRFGQVLHGIYLQFTKGSLGYLSSMYFSTSLVLGEVAAPFPQIEN